LILCIYYETRRKDCYLKKLQGFPKYEKKYTHAHTQPSGSIQDFAKETKYPIQFSDERTQLIPGQNQSKKKHRKITKKKKKKMKKNGNNKKTRTNKTTAKEKPTTKSKSKKTKTILIYL
jgi:hypothetical protein